jgi:hypothetical protein
MANSSAYTSAGYPVAPFAGHRVEYLVELPRLPGNVVADAMRLST